MRGPIPTPTKIETTVHSAMIFRMVRSVDIESPQKHRPIYSGHHATNLPLTRHTGCAIVLPQPVGEAVNECYFAILGSCAGLASNRPQKSVHRNVSVGDIAQATGEPKGRFFAPSKEIAKMRSRATSGLGKLSDGHFVGFDPAKHRMYFWF
jgi:hypothetical protein